jgi:glutaminase
MHAPTLTANYVEHPYISTGQLPQAGQVQDLVNAAYVRFRTNTVGQNSQVYPALAREPSELFGICLV